ncbi:hypothetical protein A8C32_18545 [Flavivirga aquatica]|uniref:DinB-like domain-containing protein n=1 Tax=Flavivirga aquatica TaxID=1849968 RepID=A0A1E5T3W2_9FLAO|nr:DinB family protein [Flavivirga aquatica]OEK06036.1 hypothetical protein A8C32_18545 [Flavivirga aquatica]
MNKLIDKLIESFEGTPWFGDALMIKLNMLDYKLVNETLVNSNNSIAIIVQHIINWRIFVLEKLEGNQFFDIEMNSKNDWTKITIQNKKEWDELLNKLTSTQNKLIKTLKTQNNDKLLKNMVSGRTYNFEYLIEGIIQHDIYHLGQIGLLYAQLKQ